MAREGLTQTNRDISARGLSKFNLTLSGPSQSCRNNDKQKLSSSYI